MGDTLISHVCIHCMMDTRYKNKFNQNIGSIPRPYQFANKMKSVCPNVQHVIVSVDIGEKEKIQDNGSWLDELKFIESFKKEGFTLKEKYYEVFRGSLLGEWKERFYTNIPLKWIRTNHKAVGNYYFERKEE